MKILFFGDSITDMARNRDMDGQAFGYGVGFVNSVASTLKYENPEKYEIINRGISGHRIVDLYARIKADVWNHQPDVISILIGVNDVWHEIYGGNGVELHRFEKVYRMLIEDTQAHLPNAKIILCAPFVLHGYGVDEHFEKYIGEKIKVKMIRPVEGKREFSGILESYSDGNITIRLEDESGFTFTKKEASFVKLPPFFDIQLQT